MMVVCSTGRLGLKAARWINDLVDDQVARSDE